MSDTFLFAFLSVLALVALVFVGIVVGLVTGRLKPAPVRTRDGRHAGGHGDGFDHPSFD